MYPHLITKTLRLKSALRLVALTLLGGLLATTSLSAQVRKLHTRDFTRLSQAQVAEYLKRSDIIIIPVGAVESNGIIPSGRDYVAPLAYAMLMAEELDALYVPGLIWSYPGTSMIAPSTINITPTQGIAALRPLCESLMRSGFRRQLFISSGHGPAPLTVGTLVREMFDEYRVPFLYFEMGDVLSKLKIPPQARNRAMYGAHRITSRLIDLPLKGDYAEHQHGPFAPNTGHDTLNQMGYAGSLTLGSFIRDVMDHGGGSAANLPASEAEREEWGRQGEAQLRAIVKQMKLPEAMVALKQHDEYTNQVIVPKYRDILPPGR